MAFFHIYITLICSQRLLDPDYLKVICVILCNFFFFCLTYFNIVLLFFNFLGGL